MKRAAPTKTYRAWTAMRYRCRSKTCAFWKDYGGRGISVCERWNKFENFLADMGQRPEGTSLDRINNEGNYEPSNCRWATAGEQTANRRTARLITLGGVTRSATQWARMNGLRIRLVSLRLHRGWDPIEAISTPAGGRA